jgi:hypothetical protein
VDTVPFHLDIPAVSLARAIASYDNNYLSEDHYFPLIWSVAEKHQLDDSLATYCVGCDDEDKLYSLVGGLEKTYYGGVVDCREVSCSSFRDMNSQERSARERASPPPVVVVVRDEGEVAWNS